MHEIHTAVDPPFVASLDKTQLAWPRLGRSLGIGFGGGLDGDISVDSCWAAMLVEFPW